MVNNQKVVRCRNRNNTEVPLNLTKITITVELLASVVPVSFRSQLLILINLHEMVI